MGEEAQISGQSEGSREDKESQSANGEIIRRSPEMSITQEEITRTFDAMQSRSPPPKLTPEQLNAIDLLIFGKTDKEVAETIGVGRNTISKWYKNAFFVAELNARREELWKMRSSGSSAGS
jgi:DNA-binding NarL/FixJ family response regulator